MNFMPLRFRAMPNGGSLCVNDDGRFFFGERVVEVLAGEAIQGDVQASLDAHNHRIDGRDGLGLAAHQFRLAQRLTRAASLDYLILVPTLRCNLSCSYCQVSRAALGAPGFDWSNNTLKSVMDLIDGLPGSAIKIEFQGGEPTLRPDLIAAVIQRCERFAEKQFVVCTNLHELGPDQWELFDREDLFISTSLDGDLLTHSRQRTGAQTGQFEANLRAVIDRYGPTKVSALPTIDPAKPPEIDDVIDTFAGFGLTSIFLRPINYQGFARKRHAASRDLHAAWADYHRCFVHALIERNFADRSVVLEETYFSLLLRRIYQPHAHRHVDLRNPNPIGEDYLVVDHDGQIYPTDEARMLSRSGVIDLSLGRIGEDWRGETWRLLNEHSTNVSDPACQRCAYQPYCGRDLIDDLARYGRIDVERTATAFCQRHLALFDFIFTLIANEAPAVRYSLARWLRLDAEYAPLPELLS